MAAALVTLSLIGVLAIGAPMAQATVASSSPVGKSSQVEPLPTVVISAGARETVVVTDDGVGRDPDEPAHGEVGAQTEKEILRADGDLAWASEVDL